MASSFCKFPNEIIISTADIFPSSDKFLNSCDLVQINQFTFTVHACIYRLLFSLKKGKLEIEKEKTRRFKNLIEGKWRRVRGRKDSLLNRQHSISNINGKSWTRNLADFWRAGWSSRDRCTRTGLSKHKSMKKIISRLFQEYW